MSDITPATDDQDLAERQRREYGQFVAKGPIRIGSALAFREGDPVPAGHIKRGVVSEDQVEPAPSAEPGSATALEPEDTDTAFHPSVDDEEV